MLQKDYNERKIVYAPCLFGQICLKKQCKPRFQEKYFVELRAILVTELSDLQGRTNGSTFMAVFLKESVR